MKEIYLWRLLIENNSPDLGNALSAVSQPGFDVFFSIVFEVGLVLSRISEKLFPRPLK